MKRSKNWNSRKAKALYLFTLIIAILILFLPASLFSQYCSEIEMKTEELVDKEQFQEALESAQEFLECMSGSIEASDQDTFEAYYLTAQLALKTKKYLMADSLFRQAQVLLDSEENTISESAQFWLDFAASNKSLNQQERAIASYNRALELSEAKSDSASEDLMKVKAEVGVFYYREGMYEEAAFYFEEAYNLTRAFDSTSSYLGSLASNLSTLKRKMGSYREAVEYGLIALENAKENFGTESAKYCNRLKDLCSVYTEFGMYDKATASIDEALEIANRIDENGKTYVSVLSYQGTLLRRKEEFKEAIEVQKEVLNSLGELYGKETYQYASGLNNLGMVYLEIDSLDLAISHFNEAIEIASETIGRTHMVTNSFYNNLGMAFEESEDYTAALEAYLFATNSIKSTFGETHTLYAPRLMSVGRCYAKLDSTGKAMKAYERAFDLTMDDIQQKFNSQSEGERTKFLAKVQDRFNELQSFLTQQGRQFDQSPGLSYDIELATKGMLLKSSSLLRNAVRNSEDSGLIAEYEDWLKSKKLLIKQYELAEEKRREDLAVFESLVESRENELLDLTQLSRSSESLSNWQEVQEELDKGEFAIEFMFTKDPYSEESGNYFALILESKAKSPKLVELCSEEELNGIFTKWDGDNLAMVSNIYKRGAQVSSSSSQLDNQELYKVLWQPLENSILPGSKIYFSATGQLEKIAFAALKSPEGSYLFNLYDLHQVSSTANIENIATEFSLKDNSMLLIGGLDYGTRENPQYDWAQLQNTSYEVDAIYEASVGFGLKPDMAKGSSVGEAYFKSNAENYNLIHLATHGFYFESPDENQDLLGSGVPDPSVLQKLSSNSDPLFRSGMVFSGANKYWSNGASASEEDEILTAAETSTLDLNNVELLVLSACETGLGDIRGKEGVYGLYRGFKMAGVKTMMYSLWTIADKETYEFMTFFYRSLLSGKSAEDAIFYARKEMSKQYKPYYWAGFVLID